MPLRIDTGTFDMSETIVALMSYDDDLRPKDFLGTAFFTGEEPILVTAAHNVDEPDLNVAVALLNEAESFYPAEILSISGSDDIALLSVPGYRPAHRFVLAPDDLVLQNELVLCTEYGTTKMEGGRLFLSVATRIGNITRQIKTIDILGKERNNVLEVSFPALRGASGAPVVSSQGFIVIGMLIANVSYHLSPVQIERVTFDDGRTQEEVQFMMPQGIAAHVSSIRRVFDEFNASRVIPNNGDA